jgi:hypothetical protein
MLQKEQKQVTAKTSSHTNNVRKRLSGLLQDRRQSRRLLTNNTRTAPGPRVKACDPSSADADIGLLSCGHIVECVVNEASSLGGYCIPVSSGKINPDNGYCLLCNCGTLASEAQYENVVEDVDSGYGGKT